MCISWQDEARSLPLLLYWYKSSIADVDASSYCSSQILPGVLAGWSIDCLSSKLAASASIWAFIFLATFTSILHVLRYCALSYLLCFGNWGMDRLGVSSKENWTY